MQWIVLWLAAASFAAFILYGIDKYKAKRGKWRIPEATLLGIAALGGGPGALLGMQIFRHKTKHIKFVIGVPVCILLNIITAVFLFKNIH